MNKNIQRAVADVVAKFTANNPGVKVEIEAQTIGYEGGPTLNRVIIDTDGSWEVCRAIESAFRKRRSLRVEVFSNSWRLGITDKREQEEYSLLSAAKMERLEGWWRRYHVATPEVREQMACGMIH